MLCLIAFAVLADAVAPTAAELRDVGTLTAITLALAGPLFAWLNNRTNKQYDSRLQELTAETKRCAEDREDLRREQESSRQDREQLRGEQAEMNARYEREVAALRKTIEDYHVQILRAAAADLEPRKAAVR